MASSKWKPRRKVVAAAAGALVAVILGVWGVDPEAAQDWAVVLSPLLAPALGYLVYGERLAQPPESVPPPIDPQQKKGASWAS